MQARIALVALVIAACGGDAPTTDSAPETIPLVTTVTTAEAMGAPTTAAVTSTTSAAGTETTTTTVESTASTTDTLGAAQIPDTFVAVTTDFAAVEVSTKTGEVVRQLGQASSREEIDAADDDIAATFNTIDSVVRSADGETVVAVECCEPAAGLMHYLGPGDVVTGDYPPSIPTSFGWSVGRAPEGDRFAVLGYDLMVVAGDDPTSHTLELFDLANNLGTWAWGSPAWSPAGDTVYWIGDAGDDGFVLHSVDVGAGEPAADAIPLTWVRPDQSLDGVASQASGNLVAFLSTLDVDGEYEVLETVGVVFGQDGAMATTFPVETGSTLGTYDSTGRFLIYVDGDDTVRWQGSGQQGTLGDGYIYASW